MDEEFIVFLSDRLGSEKKKLKLEKLRRSSFQLIPGDQLMFWVTVKNPKNLSRYCYLSRFFLFLSDFFDRFTVNLGRALQEGIGKKSQKENKDAKYEYRDRFNKKYFLSLRSVTDPNQWEYMEDKKSFDILDSLNLEHSTFPRHADFFRTTYNKRLYDGVLMPKEEGILIHHCFRQDQIPMLKKSLHAFGRGIAELHNKRIRQTRAPAFTEFNFEDYIRNYEQWDLHHSKEACRDVYNTLREKAVAEPFFTGITHCDPSPNNIIYHPPTDKVAFIDTNLLPQSVNAQGEGTGPIALDYAKALLEIEKRLDLLEMPEVISEDFKTSYKKMIGKHFPGKHQRRYYKFILHLYKLSQLSKVPNLTKFQLKIRDYDRYQLLNFFP